MGGCYVEGGGDVVGREITLGQSRMELTMLKPIRGDRGVRNNEEDMMEVVGRSDE